MLQQSRRHVGTSVFFSNMWAYGRDSRAQRSGGHAGDAGCDRRYPRLRSTVPSLRKARVPLYLHLCPRPITRGRGGRRSHAGGVARSLSALPISLVSRRGYSASRATRPSMLFAEAAGLITRPSPLTTCPICPAHRKRRSRAYNGNNSALSCAKHSQRCRPIIKKCCGWSSTKSFPMRILPCCSISPKTP